MDNKTVFGILMIALNQYGIPSFLQGQIKTGIMRIVLGVVSFGVIALINFVKGVILGIEILKMSDEEYAAKKGTFDTGIPAAK